VWFHPWRGILHKCEAEPSKKGGLIRGDLGGLPPGTIALPRANGAGFVPNIDHRQIGRAKKI
jgi:hypothetical protein